MEDVNNGLSKRGGDVGATTKGARQGTGVCTYGKYFKAVNLMKEK